jgi:hypothetical protein
VLYQIGTDNRTKGRRVHIVGLSAVMWGIEPWLPSTITAPCGPVTMALTTIWAGVGATGARASDGAMPVGPRSGAVTECRGGTADDAK